MKGNIRTVTGFEYLRTITKPAFWIATLAIPLVLLVVTGLMYLSNKASTDASNEVKEELSTVIALDESGLVRDHVLQTYQITEAATKEKAIAAVKDGKNKAFFYYPSDLSAGRVEVYVDGDDAVSSDTFGMIARDILKQSVASDMGNDIQVKILSGEIQTNVVTYNQGRESDLLQKAIAPGILLVLFYILVILLSNQMLNSTTEEKENRTVEMILVTLRPRTLIIGKMLAIMLAGLTQIIVIVTPLVVGYVLLRDKLGSVIPSFDFSQIVLDPERILFGVAYFVLGFLIFTSLNVFAGALAPSAKEAGAFQGLSIFSMFVPFYAFVSLVSAPESLITKIFTFFPLTQPVTLLLRNAAGNLGSIEQWAALIVMALSAAAGIALAVRAFRFGALEYSRKLKLRELLPIRKT